MDEMSYGLKKMNQMGKKEETKMKWDHSVC